MKGNERREGGSEPPDVDWLARRLGTRWSARVFAISDEPQLRNLLSISELPSSFVRTLFFT
jgi:hypothetical protein